MKLNKYLKFAAVSALTLATGALTVLFSGYFMTPHNFNGSGNVDYALNRGFCGGMYENVYLHIFNNTRRLITSCEDVCRSDVDGCLRSGFLYIGY